MRGTRRPGLRGLSLLESVVGLALAAGVFAVSVPAMQGWLHAADLAAAANELLADLHLARSEALKRNRRVALCKSADGQQCSAERGWEQGWILFHDENNDGSVDAGEELIYRREALPAHLSLAGNQPVAKYISFTALGVTKTTGGGFQAGTLTLCRRSARATPSRQVILNSVGRPRVQRSTVPACA